MDVYACWCGARCGGAPHTACVGPDRCGAARPGGHTHFIAGGILMRAGCGSRQLAHPSRHSGSRLPTCTRPRRDLVSVSARSLSALCDAICSRSLPARRPSALLLPASREGRPPPLPPLGVRDDRSAVAPLLSGAAPDVDAPAARAALRGWSLLRSVDEPSACCASRSRFGLPCRLPIGVDQHTAVVSCPHAAPLLPAASTMLCRSLGMGFHQASAARAWPIGVLVQLVWSSTAPGPLSTLARADPLPMQESAVRTEKQRERASTAGLGAAVVHAPHKHSSCKLAMRLASLRAADAAHLEWSRQRGRLDRQWAAGQQLRCSPAHVRALQGLRVAPARSQSRSLCPTTPDEGRSAKLSLSTAAHGGCALGLCSVQGEVGRAAGRARWPCKRCTSTGGSTWSASGGGSSSARPAWRSWT